MKLQDLGISSEKDYLDLLHEGTKGFEKVENLLGLTKVKLCVNCKFYEHRENGFKGIGYCFSNACLLLGKYYPLSLENIINIDLNPKMMSCKWWEKE